MSSSSERRLNAGLLVMRLGIAATQLFYALPLLFRGTHMWGHAARELRFLQVGASTPLVGLILILIEVLASVGLIAGIWFRFSTMLLAGVYSLYFFNFISIGYKTLPLYTAALVCVCLGLIYTGPGKFAVALKIEQKLDA